MEPPGPPHLALFLVLSYLPLDQLLSMSHVCKSLRDAIADDVLVWLNVIVEWPLNIRLTDEILMRITSKAQGRLRTLALLNCAKITDGGLLAVVNANPLISKLFVPGCVGLTSEGLLTIVTTLTKRSPKTLVVARVDGIYNFKKEHLQKLQFILPERTVMKPKFYHIYNNFSFRILDVDDCPIDVEICPKCKDVKLLFDCPRETCKMNAIKRHTKCRGCSYCIPRCACCGICITNDDEQGETICNDILCLDCWLSLPKCNNCNKSFCHKHAKLFDSPGHKGFICNVCQEKSLKSNYLLK